MKSRMLSKYIAKCHSGEVFTNNELEVIKNGDINTLVDTFFDIDGAYNKEQMQCTMNSVQSFMGQDIELDSLDFEKEYNGQFVGCQIMDGDIDVFLGVAGDNKELLSVASTYCQEEMKEFDEDAYDALCEFINVMNGTYAAKLSNKEVEVSMHPPVFCTNTKVKADNGFYIATFVMKGLSFKILMGADDKISILN